MSMHLQRIGAFGAVLFLLIAAACDRTSPAQGNPPAGAAAPSNDLERVATRCTERWKRVDAANWIEAYEYLPPAERKILTLVDYLQGKSKHRFEKPEKPEVLELKDGVAFVSVACMWTPVHPALANVKLGPGESLTERVEMIETWKLTEGEWYFAEATPTREFFVAHPDVPRPTPKASAPGADPGSSSPSPH
jgi:hypothetical protein